MVSIDDLRRLRFPVASDQRMIRQALERAEEVEQARARAEPESPSADAVDATPAPGRAGEAAGADPVVALPNLRITLRKIVGPQHAEERHRLIRKRLITTPSSHDMTITFAELMMLMGRLRDANFGGIRDKFFS